MATKRASVRVIGGALWSAATSVLRAMDSAFRFTLSTWILRSLASAVQRAMSAWMYSPNCSGLIGIGSTASADSFSLMSGAASVAFSVSLSCLTTAAGMPAGPTTPYHCSASKPLKPDSISVGTSLTVRMPAVAGDRQRPHAARADVRQRRRQAGEHRLRLAADQVGEGRRDAAVRHVQHERTRLLLEQLHRQVRQRAGAGRAVAASCPGSSSGSR